MHHYNNTVKATRYRKNTKNITNHADNVKFCLTQFTNCSELVSQVQTKVNQPAPNAEIQAYDMKHGHWGNLYKTPTRCNTTLHVFKNSTPQKHSVLCLLQTLLDESMFPLVLSETWNALPSSSWDVSHYKQLHCLWVISFA